MVGAMARTSCASAASRGTRRSSSGSVHGAVIAAIFPSTPYAMSPFAPVDERYACQSARASLEESGPGRRSYCFSITRCLPCSIFSAVRASIRAAPSGVCGERSSHATIPVSAKLMNAPPTLRMARQ